MKEIVFAVFLALLSNGDIEPHIERVSSVADCHQYLKPIIEVANVSDDIVRYHAGCLKFSNLPEGFGEEDKGI